MTAIINFGSLTNFLDFKAVNNVVVYSFFVLVCFSVLWDILTVFIWVNVKGPWHISDNYKSTTCAFKLCECGFGHYFCSDQMMLSQTLQMLVPIYRSFYPDIMQMKSLLLHKSEEREIWVNNILIFTVLLSC